MRNKNKKLEAIKDLEAKITSGEVVPDDAQKKKVSQKQELSNEIKQLQKDINKAVKDSVAK